MEKKSKNQYSYPVKMSANIKVSYDESPAHVGALSFAVDFIVPDGTPILAAADGVVVDVKSDGERGGEDKSFEPDGNFVEIWHEHDEYSEYEHFKKNGVVVRVGDKVKRGEAIGYSGATGWLAHLGPHLHFMVGKYDRGGRNYQTVFIIWKDKID